MSIEMKRIGWEDEPSTQTPIDSGNLKKMEDNAEDAINELDGLQNGIVLFENSEGLNDNITLNEDISNFNEIKIDYTITFGDYTINKSERTFISNNKSFLLTVIIPHSEVLQIIETARYKISNTKITKDYETDSRISTTGIAWEGEAARFKIVKITGYK